MGGVSVWYITLEGVPMWEVWCMEGVSVWIVGGVSVWA